MGSMEFSGQQIRHPIEISGIGHMAIAVQLRKSHRAALRLVVKRRRKAHRKRQLSAPQKAWHLHSAAARHHHGTALQIHQQPQRRCPEKRLPLRRGPLVKPGISGTGGLARPSLQAQPLTNMRQALKLYALPGHRPEQPATHT